jgi:hypothetical protein
VWGGKKRGGEKGGGGEKVDRERGRREVGLNLTMDIDDNMLRV